MENQVFEDFISNAEIEANARKDFLDLNQKLFKERKAYWGVPYNISEEVEEPVIPEGLADVQQAWVSTCMQDFADIFKVPIGVVINCHLNYVSNLIFHRVMGSDEVDLMIREDSNVLKRVKVHEDFFKRLELMAGENYTLLSVIDFYWFCVVNGRSMNDADSYVQYLNLKGIRHWRNQIL